MKPFFACVAVCVAVVSSCGEVRAQEGVQLIANLGRCQLESGKVVEDCRIGYRTFGALNAARSNAVLMPTWLYGTSNDLASLFHATPSPSQLVDTSKYFGIAVDALGNGVSSSPSNSKRQHGTAFPEFTSADLVETQFRLTTEVLHLRHMHAVVGLSMGGEQTFMWAVRHPDFFDLAVPIISTPKLTVFDLQSKRIMLEAIRSDPDFKGGQYTTEPGLRLANLYNVQAVTSPEYRNSVTSRQAADDFFATAEAPLAIDANDRVSQLQAVVTHDVLRGRTIDEAARVAGPKFLIIVSARDRMVVPSEALRWAAAAHAPTYVSDGTCAHLIMSCDGPAVSARVTRFLDGQPLP